MRRQALIKGNELRTVRERSGKRKRVTEPQRAVPGPKRCPAAGECAVDGEHRDRSGGEELIDLGIGAPLKRPHHHLRVDARAYQQVVLSYNAETYTTLG